MKKIYKHLGIIFIIAFAIMVGCFSNSVFAADDGVVGTTNLNNTAENSAKLKEQLLHPEKGWKRYDDTNSNIKFTGTWLRQSTSVSYNNDFAYTATDGNTLSFNFVGSKLRIIGCVDRGRPNFTIKIDNEVYNGTEDGSICYTALVYEKLNLTNKEHSVMVTIPKIDKGNVGYFILDAIDIDSEGQLKPYNENISTIVSNITLNKTTDTLQVGQVDALTATITPDDATDKTVTWTSSDPTIATVDSNGNVTAVKEGTITIIATTQDGSNLSASCTVNVTAATPDNNGSAILTITMTNGNIKSYTISMSKVNDFISWYDNRASGSTGKAYYTFDKTDNLQPFSKKTEYLVFDKISSFEVDEYSK